VWPGYCHFPDVLNPEHRYWFGEQYRSLTELGVDGFWNDMNEPSIFYTDKNLNEAYEMVDELRNEELDLTKYFSLRKKFATLTNNPKDYQLFYHTIDGKKVRHDKVHNLFGYNMTRAAKEALDRFDPTQRKLLFSRSSMIGMHRYSGIWTGDNHAWWSHLKLNIQQMPSLDMCGFLYAGADLGGFSGDTNEELMIRWITFGIFTPLMRNHSQSQRPQELYQFKQTDILRNLVNLRYALLPYLYSEFVKATLEYRSLFRPLAFDYPEDLDAKLIDDQLLVGESIMLAPIYTQNGKGRYVYLPEEMLMVRMQSEDNFTTKILPRGHHFIQVPLGELVFFIRNNHVVPMAKSALNTQAMDFSTLELLGFITDDCEYILYDDDGYSKDYQNPTHYHTLRLHPTDCECQTKTVKYKISMD
jgi:alpha-glucosidase